MSKLNDRTDLDDTDEPEDTEDTPRKKDRKTFRNTKYRRCINKVCSTNHFNTSIRIFKNNNYTYLVKVFI